MNKKQQSIPPTESATAEPVGGNDRKMEQVRDLLFGSVVREHDRRFAELNERLTQETARIERDTERRLAALESRLEAVVERWGTQLRQESSARNGALEDLDARIVQLIKTYRVELGAGIERLEGDLSGLEVRSREELAAFRTQATASLQTLRDSAACERDALRAEKVGREDLADMMGELSLRLRGIFGAPDTE